MAIGWISLLSAVPWKDVISSQHYCLIKHLSRLLASQTGGHTMQYCRRCLNGFREIKSLAKYNEYCSQHNAVKPKLPEPGTVIQFKNYIDQ